MARHRVLQVVMAVLLGLLIGTVPARAGGDFEIISNGERVELESELVAGKWVLFDFYADWCTLCRQLDPQLKALAGRHPEALAVRKIVVPDWRSDVARQYGVQSLPHLRLFDPGGALVSRGDMDTVMPDLLRAMGEAGPAAPSLLSLGAFAFLGAVVLWFMFGRRRGARLQDQNEE